MCAPVASHKKRNIIMAVEPGRPQASPLQIGAVILADSLSSFHKESPPPAQPAMGFFTDTSLCIGCKACEVACKQWNQLPAIDPVWSGTSYDNTKQLGATTWRHVQFIEQIGRGRPAGSLQGSGPTGIAVGSSLPPALPLFEDQVAVAKNNGTIL